MTIHKDMECHRLEKRLNDRFLRAMATFHLIEDNDRILVGLSGGKDSLLLTEILARRAQIHHPCFSVEAVHVRMENIHYETDTSYLQRFCDSLGIPLHIVTTRFETGKGKDGTLDERKQKSPCFLCSWMRRKQLFNLAQTLGCNKIALGHHQDDLIHTALMNLFFQGRFDTMSARLKMRKMPITIIRPLCLMSEDDIAHYAEARHYEKQKKLCPYENDSHRTDVRQLYMAIRQVSPEARQSIWRAIESAGKLIEE